ncbi:MAG: SMI1/KNR4 family protein, partial [Lachnospiraceae bacterium]|nr:SMI1/KNR4 family protein [Lachnospiraceae bacterium]
RVQKELGISFPKDYINFIDYYGTGGIGDFLWFLTLFEEDLNVNYKKRSSVMLDAYQESKQKLPEYYSHNLYLEDNGLLPFAYTDNGDELYWLTKGKPEQWHVVIYESRSPKFYYYAMGLIEFLYKIVKKLMSCEIFDDDMFYSGMRILQ